MIDHFFFSEFNEVIFEIFAPLNVVYYPILSVFSLVDVLLIV